MFEELDWCKSGRVYYSDLRAGVFAPSPPCPLRPPFLAHCPAQSGQSDLSHPCLVCISRQLVSGGAPAQCQPLLVGTAALESDRFSLSQTELRQLTAQMTIDDQ